MSNSMSDDEDDDYMSSDFLTKIKDIRPGKLVFIMAVVHGNNCE